MERSKGKTDKRNQGAFVQYFCPQLAAICSSRFEFMVNYVKENDGECLIYGSDNRYYGISAASFMLVCLGDDDIKGFITKMLQGSAFRLNGHACASCKWFKLKRSQVFGRGYISPAPVIHKSYFACDWVKTTVSQFNRRTKKVKDKGPKLHIRPRDAMRVAGVEPPGPRRSDRLRIQQALNSP
jgi:hypothetical protein